MHTATLVQIEDSVMLAIPPEILARMNLKAGAKVKVSVDDGRLVIERHRGRGRYTLDRLVDEARATGEYPLAASQREWIDAKACGRELL